MLGLRIDCGSGDAVTSAIRWGTECEEVVAKRAIRVYPYKDIHICICPRNYEHHVQVYFELYDGRASVAKTVNMRAMILLTVEAPTVGSLLKHKAGDFRACYSGASKLQKDMHPI